MGLRLRGNTEGDMRAASKHKKLRIHAGTHYHAFYSAEGRLDQLRFLDHWLKGIDTGIMREPPVKLLIRKGGAATTPGAVSANGRSSAPDGHAFICGPTAAAGKWKRRARSS